MLIRPVEPRDHQAITDILNHEIVTGVAHFATEPLTLAQVGEHFAAEQDRYPWYAAEVDGRAIGFCKSGPWKPRGAYAWAVEISVYVRPDHHGKGIGRALYDALVPDLRARGFRTMIAGATMPNPASERLHLAIGMTQAARFPANGFKHGRWHDVVYWSMDLHPVADDEALPTPLGFSPTTAGPTAPR